MKEEEKQRKLHEALLKMLYPPPPSPPSSQEDDEGEREKLIERLSDLPEEELEDEEGHSLPSSSDNDEGDNSGAGKLTRAQRKRLRKRKLKEAASRRRKIIGPVFPGSGDDGNGGSVAVADNVPEGARQNAPTDFSGEPVSCSKQNKVKRRRKSKKLNSSSIDSSTSHDQS